MHAHFYRTLWGNTQPLDTYLAKLRDRGYVGVETGLLFLDDAQKAQLPDLLRLHELNLVLAVITFGCTHGPTSVAEHVESYQKQVEESLQFPVRPEKINVQGGVDAWREQERDSFYQQILAWEQSYLIPTYGPITIVHETHRSKCFFTPWTTAQTLRKFPALRVNCDLSHWVLVCERFLQGEEFRDDMELVMERYVLGGQAGSD